jgi:hypothetical protein
MPTSERSRSIAVVLLALAVRAAWAAVVPVVPISDSGVYHLLASNIASGVGYAFTPGNPSAYWPVGTSAIYSLLYRTFGVSYTPIVVLNILVGGLTVALVMALTRAWYGSRAALLAGLALALWPGQIMFTTILASELLFNLGWLAGLYFSGRDRWPAALRIPLVAACMAATSLVRPLSLPMPLIFAWLQLNDPGGQASHSRGRIFRVGGEALATLALMLLLISPWAERNRRAFGEVILVSVNGGVNLWMGNNPESNGGFMHFPARVIGMNEVVRDRFLKDEAVAYIKARPIAFVGRTARKVVQTHDRESINIAWNEKGLIERFGPRSLLPLKLVSTAYWLTMLTLGGIGVICVWMRGGARALIGDPAVVLWSFFLVVHAIIVSGDRYHMPSIPLISALAGLTLATWFDRDPERIPGTS